MGALTLLCFSPKALRSALAALLARINGRLNNRHRRTAAINIAAGFADSTRQERERLLYAYFRVFWQTVFLQPRLWFASAARLENHTRYHGLRHIDQAIAEGSPVVLLVTHTVGLDQGLVAMTSRYSMHGIYKPFENPVMEWLTHRARARFGGKPAARGNQFRAMIRYLQQGHLLCYLCDEDFGPEGSVFAPFLGRRKATLAMLPRIVGKVDNTRVLPMATYYDEQSDGFEVRIWPPISDYPCVEDVDSATRMNAAIESTIRYRPAQFLWKLRIFRTPPDGSGSRYRRLERGEIDIGDL